MSIQVGDNLTYYPPQDRKDNLHYPCIVLELRKIRVKIRYFSELAPDGRVSFVSRKRLIAQADMLEAE